MSAASPRYSDWRPLQHPVFRALWGATVVSYVGSAMQDAVAPAFMSELTDSRLLVALMQSAAALPICLLALPAGAVADVVNRRRLLIATQIWMLVAAALLGAMTLLHFIQPGASGAAGLLLALTFVLGIGAAMSGPAFLRVLPELVGSEQMPAAMALNSIALNVARAAGPALGVLAIALYGAGAAFVFNAVTFAGVAWVLFRWREAPEHHRVSPEGFWAAMGAGVRYTWRAPRLRAVLIRVGVFIFCASAMWAMMPVLAKEELGLPVPAGYCWLMACLGAGAVAGIMFMPAVQRRVSTDRMVGLATAVFALAVAGLGVCRVPAVSCAIMFVMGANWVIILTNFNIATQLAVPAWVKGRAMSMYLLTLWGSWALGAAVWGALARSTSAHLALLVSAGGLALGLLAVGWFPLMPREGSGAGDGATVLPAVAAVAESPEDAR